LVLGKKLIAGKLRATSSKLKANRLESGEARKLKGQR
jgi:hypothetical protein